MIRVFSQYVSPKSFLLVGVETALLALSLLCAVKFRFWRAPARNILILGSGTLASTVAREIVARQDLKLNLVGFVQEQPAPARPVTLFDHPILGDGSELEALILKNRVSRIVVAMEDRRGA